jgi:hypothetical protein
MPTLGDKKYGREISGGTYSPNEVYVWVQCPDCLKTRWAIEYNYLDQKIPGMCSSCCRLGKRHFRWKGKYLDKKTGYIFLKVPLGDPFFCMTNGRGEILEHRYVMAKKLNRPLKSWELVHHKGTKFPMDSKEDRGDNREENLELVTTSENLQIKLLFQENERLRQEVLSLQKKLGEK